MKRGIGAAGHPIAAQFPGEIAGASLKPAWIRTGGAAKETEFPGEIAGASLKRASRPGGRFGRVRIPRRNRRGLIEAGTFHGPKCGVWAEFPGEIAGASLKPMVEVEVLPHDAGNSPAKSPGPH